MKINASPDTSIDDALKIYFRDREFYSNKHIIFAIGEYTLHQIALSLK